jgi:hypothetical protein
MATMTSLIGLINKIQRACTVLGDHGGEGLSLWEALPSVAVVGGQVTTTSFLFFFFFYSFHNYNTFLFYFQKNLNLVCSIFIRVQENHRCWKV